MRKWKVLIVDDEFRIGMLIKKLIHWEEFQLECLDVVDNGERAFDVIQSDQCPDIVITDIRMPKVSGLELIEMTRAKNKKIKFVVVSGYKEFEYAHQALQYGVEDYLLKPISEVELNRVMKKIATELGAYWRGVIETEKMQRTVSESRHIIKRDFLKNIIETQDEMNEEDSSIVLEGEIYRGIDIKLDYVDYNKRDKKQDRLTISRIEEIVEGILKADAKEVLTCEKENLHLYCLFNYDYSKSKQIRNSINDILSEIKGYLLGFEQYEVTIGVGKERTEFGEIRFSIKEAHRAVGNRIKNGVGRLIYAEGIPYDARAKEGFLEEAWKEQLKSAVESYSPDRIEQLINQSYGRHCKQSFQSDFVTFVG